MFFRSYDLFFPVMVTYFSDHASGKLGITLSVCFNGTVNSCNGHMIFLRELVMVWQSGIIGLLVTGFSGFPVEIGKICDFNTQISLFDGGRIRDQFGAAAEEHTARNCTYG